jgi:hypothetical protein
VNDDTCASAFQFIIAPNQMVVFSAQGKASIASINAAVAAEARSTDDCATITDKVDVLMDGMATALFDPASYTPGDPGVHLAPQLNVNRYQDNQAA